MNMLASDLANPEFTNPMDPDALLHVEFYWHEPVDAWETAKKSQEAGRRIEVRLPKQVFVRIMKPGDNTSILEVPVREDHKRRWPQKWLYFQMQEGLVDDGVRIPGWKLEDWEEVKDNVELLRGLKFMRFHTVEQIAGASDAQVQGLGLGGFSLREKAKSALQQHVSAGVQAEIASRDKIIAEQGEALKALQAQMAQLLNSEARGSKPVEENHPSLSPRGQVTPEVMSGQAVAVPVKKRRGMPKGGWPKKDK